MVQLGRLLLHSVYALDSQYDNADVNGEDELAPPALKG